MLFLVVNGVPSIGQFVMVGSGKLGTQPTTTNVALPSSHVVAITANTTSPSESSASAASTSKSAAVKMDVRIPEVGWAMGMILLGAMVGGSALA
jgi:hypothetical protein